MDSSSGDAPLLSGVRVLSFGSVVAGNTCAVILAELGADVVKVESWEHPESLRAYDSAHQSALYEPSGVRTTALFAGLTRSMRSVSIEMEITAGRETFRTLVEHADVVIENLGPGKMDSWRCGFAELTAHNPRVVMISISGYGRTGPLAAYKAYASNINNYLGLTAAWALDGTHFDFVAGVHGASAVLGALAEVERGARGVFIDMAQTEAGAAVMAPLYLDFLANGREGGAAPNEVPGALLSAVCRCQGADEWVALELEDGRDWAILCAFLERDDLVLQGGTVTPARRDALNEALENWTRTVTALQATLKLQHAGLAVGAVQNDEDLWRDGQLRSRGCFVEVEHPDIGLVEYPAGPNRLSRTPGQVRARSARLGEHTGAVLAEWLGCDEAAVRALRQVGAVWQPDDTSAYRQA
jgi:benzylsuccinate CoA-transferase BbsF subunit